MLRNYLLVSLRNLRRHFTYSFINIFGLTVGLACTMIIGIWVYQEYSYERHFQQAEDIYRVGVNFYNIGDMARGPRKLKSSLVKYSDIERVANLWKIGELTLLEEGKESVIENVFQADEDFFKLFSYTFLNGSVTALDQPDGAVVTEELALRLFGSLEVLGKTLKFKDNPQTYNVRGVVAGEGKSHIPAAIWLSSEPPTERVIWTSASPFVYSLINSDNAASRLGEILEEIRKEEVFPTIGHDNYEEFKASGIYQFLPIALTSIHLESEMKFEASAGGNKMATDVFAGVAILILVLASINFINISTARASVRAKEVGIRKSLGTSKVQLICQFILESILISVFAMGLGMVIGEVLLNSFEAFTGLELLNSLFSNPTFVLVSIIGSVVIGILAGLYPAFYITRFQTIKVLKGNMEVNEKGFLRNGLVLFQFVISISLLVVSMFVFSQLKFIQDKDLGINTENVLVIRNLQEIAEHKAFLKEELEKFPQVEMASLIHRVPGSTSITIQSLPVENGDEIWFQAFGGDENMLESLGYRLLAGRNFSDAIASDSSAIILNETAAEMLEFQDPIGKTLNNGEVRIIGVVSDFNYESLKKKVEPTILRRGDGHNLAIKFSGKDPSLLLEEIEKIWTGLGAEENPDYYFLDENYERFAERELVLSKAILIFTVLAMFISCLGLYGLSVFTAERRTKEIGIRRVLGASLLSILKLLNRKFALPILAAFLISVPLSFLAVNEWLSNYAYRIDISPLVFLIGGIIALVIGLSTVSWQSARTALQNPVTSLRNE